jgi:hypothetical protein
MACGDAVDCPVVRGKILVAPDLLFLAGSPLRAVDARQLRFQPWAHHGLTAARTAPDYLQEASTPSATAPSSTAQARIRRKKGVIGVSSISGQ